MVQKVFIDKFISCGKTLGYSGADLDRYSGVTNCCMARVVAAGKKPETADLIRGL